MSEKLITLYHELKDRVEAAPGYADCRQFLEHVDKGAFDEYICPICGAPGLVITEDEKEYMCFNSKCSMPSGGSIEAYAAKHGKAEAVAVLEMAKKAGISTAEYEKAVKQDEAERRQRSGAGMVDSFLQAVTSDKYQPIPTGFADIDRKLGGGFTNQHIILLGAAPGVGKTALAQWIFENMAKRGRSFLYLNLEMSRDQMLARSLARVAANMPHGGKISPTEILQGYGWNIEQMRIVNAAAEEYKKTIAPRMTYNPEGVTANLDSILEYINAEADRAEAAGLESPCAVIDYLQLIRGRDREDETAIIKRTMAELKAFAIRHNTFVCMIMAHNRKANETGAITMQSGRDSSALEYGADVQLGLTYTACLTERKSPDELSSEERRSVTLRVLKNRWGDDSGGVNLKFIKESMDFQFLTEMQPWPPESTATPKAGRKI